MPKLPPLSALRAFHALGEQGSVRAAGDALGVSHTAVSRHIRNLELALGVKLMQPAGRGVVLTQAGLDFHASVANAFEVIIEGADRLTRQRLNLKICCPPGFAELCLVPRLSELVATVPKRNIVLEPRLSRRAPKTADADIELVFLPNLVVLQPLQADTLSRPRIFPVASPSFLKSRPAIKRPEDLLKMPLIHEENSDLWTIWFKAMDCPLPAHGTYLGSASISMEAVRQGQGIAIANELLAARDLRTGRLREILHSVVQPRAYYIIAQADQWNRPDIVAVRRWFAALCSQLMSPSD